MQLFFCCLFLFLCHVSGKEISDTVQTESNHLVVNDSLDVDTVLVLDESSVQSIPQDTMQIIDDLVLLDSLDVDTVPALSESSDTAQYKTMYRGWQIGFQWRFGSTPPIREWVDYQERLTTEWYDRVREQVSLEDKYPPRQYILQDPQSQGVGFPLSVGFMQKLNSRMALHVFAGYSYRSTQSTFYIENSLDTTEEYFRSNNRLQNHTAFVSVGVDFAFDKRYFEISGIEESGVSVAVSAIPFSRYVQTSTISGIINTANGEKRTSLSGYGGGWHLSLFVLRALSDRADARFHLGYNGLFQQGFKGYNQLVPGEFSELGQNNNNIRFIETLFELGATIIIGRKKDLINEES